MYSGILILLLLQNNSIDNIKKDDRSFLQCASSLYEKTKRPVIAEFRPIIIPQKDIVLPPEASLEDVICEKFDLYYTKGANTNAPYVFYKRYSSTDDILPLEISEWKNILVESKRVLEKYGALNDTELVKTRQI
jgi:hypothetical protein